MQTIYCNNTQSSLKNVTCGILQGSTLDPLLFITYINDLPFASSFKRNLFADDTNLTLSGTNPELLQNEVNSQLLKIDNWMKTNKLTINYSKTKFYVSYQKENQEL